MLAVDRLTHPRWAREAEGFGDRTEVHSVDIEDVLQLMGVVCEDVAPVGILCALVQVVILLHQLLQLALHICNFALGEVVLVQWDSRLL